MASLKPRETLSPPSANAAELQDRLERLAAAIAEVRAGTRLSARTIKLLKSGRPKMAQKVIEEAAELGIEAVRGDRRALINESVDLLYNLAVLWSDAAVSLVDICLEMDRREQLLGMAEKLPKKTDEDS
jgi:phosphoribosyl-ATP pyrophosphohydrolase